MFKLKLKRTLFYSITLQNNTVYYKYIEQVIRLLTCQSENPWLGIKLQQNRNDHRFYIININASLDTCNWRNTKHFTTKYRTRARPHFHKAFNNTKLLSTMQIKYGFLFCVIIYHYSSITIPFQLNNIFSLILDLNYIVGE